MLETILLWIIFITTAAFSIRSIAQNYDLNNDKLYYVRGLNIFLVLKGIFILIGIFCYIIYRQVPAVFIGLAPFFLIRMVEMFIYSREL